MSLHNFEDINFQVETLGNIPPKSKDNEKQPQRQQRAQPLDKNILYEEEQEFTLTGLGDTQFQIPGSNNDVFKWEGPLKVPLPSGDRNRGRSKINIHSGKLASSLPQISPSGRSTVVTQQPSITSSEVKRQRRRSVTEAVEFATGKLPGKQDQFHSLGRQVPNREVATLRKDTIRLEQKFKTAIAALRNKGVDGSSNSVASPVIGGNDTNMNDIGGTSSFFGGGGSSFGGRGSPDLASEVTGHIGASAVDSVGGGHHDRSNGNGQNMTLDPSVLVKYEGEAASMKIMVEEELKASFVKLAAVVDAHNTRLTSQVSEQRSAILAADAMQEFNQDVWKGLITSLASCRYEQKHLDVCVGELSEQVSVTAYEQGRLLAHLRVAYNESMNRGVSTVHTCLELLEAAMNALGRAREHELDNNLRQEQAVEETRASADAELGRMQKLVDEKQNELATEKKRFQKELASKQTSLRGLQSILQELQTDSATKEVIDIRNRAAKAEQLLAERDKELNSLQSVREAASQAGVLERRLHNANLEVKRLQEELTKRSEVLENMLEGEADSRFDQAAEAAMSSEKAVVMLASLDPTINSNQVLPPTKPAPGSLICVRCSRSLNKVMACEADVSKVNSLEHSRPCKAMVQLLGPIPRGLKLKPPLPPSVPSEDEVVDIHAPVVEKVDAGSLGPFSLNHLRRMLADGPPGHLFEAPVTILSYPDCRKFKPESLAKDPESDDDDDEEQEEETYDAAIHLHFPGSPASAAAEKAYRFSAGKGMGKDHEKENEEQTLSVFHGASPWWVRLVMRAILWAKVEDEMVHGPTTKFVDFVWGWFDPTDSMREAYRNHLQSLHTTVDPKAAPKKVSNVAAVADLTQLVESRRWLFFDGLRQLAAEGSEVIGVGEGSKTGAGMKHQKVADPEAALFWTLLDGRNGNDYERFLLHALECLEAAFPFHDARLRNLLGPAASATDFAMLVANTLEVEAAAGADAHQFTLSAPSLAIAVAPQRMWLPLWAIMQATRVLLSKAPSGLRERVLGTLGGLAVVGKGRLAPRPKVTSTDRASQEEEAAAQESEEKEKAVDMFLWLKVIMRCYKEEQVNRDAAVRVMFSSVQAGNRGKERASKVTRQSASETVSSGASLISKSSAKCDTNASVLSDQDCMLTASQCVAMAKSLDVNCSATLAVAVYRKAAELGVVLPSPDDMVGVPLRAVVVRPEDWLAAAEEYGLLTSCLNLRGRIVSNRRAADIEGLSRAGAMQIGSIIHLRMQLIMPYLKSLLPRLPAPTSSRFAASVREVCKALKTTPPPIFGTDSSTKSRKKKRKMLVKKSKSKDDEGKGEGSEGVTPVQAEGAEAESSDLPPPPLAPKVFIAISVDGSAALVAYRRLLALMGSLRREQNETGRVGVFPLTSTAWDDTKNDMSASKSRQVVQRIATELLTAEFTVFPSGCLPLTQPHATAKAIVQEVKRTEKNPLEALVSDPRIKIKPLQRHVAVTRLVLWWRRLLALRLLQGNLCPLKAVALMGRPGMLAGRGGGLKARKMHWSANLIMSTVAHCVGGLCVSLQQSKNTSLAQVVHERGLVLLGMPTLAERFVVDLCFNVNNLQRWFPRCRLFGLLLGGMGSSSVPACWVKDETVKLEARLGEQSESSDRRTRDNAMSALLHLGSQQRGDGLIGLASRAIPCSILEREIRDSCDEASEFYAKAVSVVSQCFHRKEVQTNTTRIMAASLATDACDSALRGIEGMMKEKAQLKAQGDEKSSRKKRKARIDPDAASKEKALLEANKARIIEIEKMAKETLARSPQDLFPCTKLEGIKIWGKTAKAKSPYIIMTKIVTKRNEEDEEVEENEWRLSKSLLFGESFISEAQRQRQFGGKWKNTYYASGGSDSVLCALADLFQPRPPAPPQKPKKQFSAAHRALIETNAARRVMRYEQDVAAAKSNLKPDVRERSRKRASMASPDMRRASVSPDSLNSPGSLSEKDVSFPHEVYATERRKEQVFGDAPAKERPTDSRPIIENRLIKRLNDLHWDSESVSADDVLWAVMMLWAENRHILKSWCSRSSAYARDFRKVCAPCLDSAIAISAMAHEERLKAWQTDEVLLCAGHALGGKPYKSKKDVPPSSGVVGRSRGEVKPVDAAFALRDFRLQPALALEGISPSSSSSSTCDQPDSKKLWSMIQSVTHMVDTAGTIVELKSPFSLEPLRLNDMVVNAALKASCNNKQSYTTPSFNVRYCDPLFIRDFIKMVWSTNEKPLDGHIANLIIDARRLAPVDKCGVPGFGGQSELPLHSYLKEKAACDDVINAPSSGESLKWCLEEAKIVKELLRECNALQADDDEPLSKTSLAYKKKQMALKKKKMIEEQELNEGDKKYLKHFHLTLENAKESQKLRENKERKLLNASQRIRSLFAHVGVAQDRVAVSTLVGAQNFVRDGWAGGHKGSSKPDTFPPCE